MHIYYIYPIVNIYIFIIKENNKKYINFDNRRKLFFNRYI